MVQWPERPEKLLSGIATRPKAYASPIQFAPIPNHARKRVQGHQWGDGHRSANTNCCKEPLSYPNFPRSGFELAMTKRQSVNVGSFYSSANVLSQNNLRGESLKACELSGLRPIQLPRRRIRLSGCELHRPPERRKSCRRPCGLLTLRRRWP